MYHNVNTLATVWSISSQSNDWSYAGLIYYFHYQQNNQLSILTFLHFILRTSEFCENPKYVNSSGCVAQLICCKRIIHKLQQMLYFSNIQNIKLTYKWKIRNRTSIGKEKAMGGSWTLHKNNTMYCTLNVYTKLHLHNYTQCQLKYHKQLSEILSSEGSDYEVYNKLNAYNSTVHEKSHIWCNCDMWSYEPMEIIGLGKPKTDKKNDTM